MLEANEIYSADVATGAVNQLTQRGGSTSIAEISRDGKTIVGTTSSSQRPTELYVTTADFRSPTEHSRITMRWLADYSLAESEVVKWKSKDGMEVEGVLTKPVGYTAGAKCRFC